MKFVLSGSAFVVLTSITTIACAGMSPSAANAAASPPAAAGQATAQQPVPPPAADANIKRLLQTMGESSTWGHPDLFGQFAGMQRLFEGDYEGALKYFKIGSRYADKLSQLSIGMMYLNGRGVSKDPAIACAWITLAAERGYPTYVTARNKICAALNPAQHDLAETTLKTLRPEYGDVVAKQRMKLALTTARNALTGSHLGHDSGVLTMASDSSPVNCGGYTLYLGGVEVPRRGCGRYDPNLLQPKNYFSARDAQWFGTVTVGALSTPVMPENPNTPASNVPHRGKD
ncbi:sel1 repeat family protein [Rhodanobacter sp. AS-Z3]|uniref:tetratricopeptide repeat protein n=1 Tax=Rhodanobacter sp. AS-Z3 TaxID=3031330 RepID=UPI00247A746B|nr:sel1 repeat family protein [Rhodanobacter sp. AS-Z3]WEN14784.1 sel1 repeat family protein [Rhodanobacter sp. AS-Z3]